MFFLKKKTVLDINVLLYFIYLHCLSNENVIFCKKTKGIFLSKSSKKLIRDQFFKIKFSKGLLIKSP